MGKKINHGLSTFPHPHTNIFQKYSLRNYDASITKRLVDQIRLH